MADIQAGSPDASKSPPAVPDLKKALENKPEPFAWTPGVAKSAATLGAAPRRAPTALERLNSTPGRLAVMAGLMLAVGGGLSLTAFHEGGVGGGGGDLSKPHSTIKSRAFYKKDGVSLARGRDDSKADRMKINARAGGTNSYDVEVPAVAVPGAPEGEGGEGMNYDEGGTSRGSGVSAGGAQGAAGNAKGGGGTDAFSAGGVAAPKLSSTGKIKFQGMRRISGTAGFRGIGGRQGMRSKINTRGSSANTAASDAGGRGGVKGGSSFASLAEGGGVAGAGAGSGGKADAGDGSDSGGGGGGGGGGAGGDVNTDGLDDMQDNIPTIPELLGKAASLRKDADKEEKKAKVLAVQGQMPQAHYHYNKAEKKKKEAKGYEDQANQLTQAMQDTAAGMTVPKDP